MSFVTWDIETTIKQRFRRKATPFGGLNHVVMHGWKRKADPAKTVHSHYFGRVLPGPGWFRPLLAGTKLLIGFNIKFDLLHALQDADNLDAWMEYVADGGMIWDVQLAEYLLNGMAQTEHMLSLDEVAPRYGGSLKVDEVKRLWEAGIDTTEIDPQLLKDYLCGRAMPGGDWDMGDVENTERCALAQIDRARACGQLDSILLNMGALIFTTEAERNGMFVDKATGLVIAEELKVEIDKVRTLLEGFLPHNLPFPFKWTSRFHKSALIFGGRVKYERREYRLKDDTFTFEPPQADTLGLYAYTQTEVVHYVLADGSTMECGWWEHCDGTEWKDTGRPDSKDRVEYKTGKNKGEFKTKKVKCDDLTNVKSRMGEDYFTFEGFTTPKPEWESSDKGVYSTAGEVIEELGVRDIPFLKAFSQLQAMTKDLGTYYLTVDEKTGEQKGMLALVDEHGIIHHKLNQTSTVTARLSSSDPNLQNLSKGDKSKVKTIFVSRFGPDGKVIQSDFTSLEIYVQAILTGCKQLIEDLKAGLDMHVLRLSQSPAGEGKTYEELLDLCVTRKEGNWSYKRTDSKVYSFQAAYGAGDQKIADTTGMDVDTVAGFRAADNERYPEIPRYYDMLTEQIKKNRKPGPTVPHPDIPGIMCCLGTSFARTPDGKLYSYRESPAPSFIVKHKDPSKRATASFSPTEIKNYVVQGGGGEWAKAAMYLAVRAFYAMKNWGGLALLVNQVHDACYADAHKDAAFEAACTLHAAMEAASDYMEWKFKWHVPVPVPSVTGWGASMADENKIEGLPERSAQIRRELRAKYMGGYTPSFIH